MPDTADHDAVLLAMIELHEAGRPDAAARLAASLGGAEGVEMAAGEWAPYEGPKGGRGWRNTRTGDVEYGDERPGGDGGARPPAADAPEAPAFRHPEGYRPPSPRSAPNAGLPKESQPALELKEARAMGWYASHGYRNLNRALYAGKSLAWSAAGIEGTLEAVVQGGSLSLRPSAAHAALQSAFAKAPPFERPVKVVRGLKFPGDRELAEYVARFQAAGPGGRVRMAGYQSTSVGSDTTSKFEGTVKLSILAKQGLDVAPYSLFHHESELLLNHDSEFVVHKVERDAQGVWQVQLEQVLDEAPEARK